MTNDDILCLAGFFIHVDFQKLDILLKKYNLTIDVMVLFLLF